MASLLSRIVTVIAIAIIVFLADQASKWAILNIVMQPQRITPILPFFNLTLGFNTGVSFGLFSDTLEDKVG